jgi:hypothetical protein
MPNYFVLSEKDRQLVEETVRRVLNKKLNSSVSDKDPIGGFSRIYVAQSPSPIDAITIDSEEETVTVGVSDEDVPLMTVDEDGEGAETSAEAHNVLNVSLSGIPKNGPFILFRLATGEWLAQVPVITVFAWAKTIGAVKPEDKTFAVTDITTFDGSSWTGDSPLIVSNDPDAYQIDAGVIGKIMSLVNSEGEIEWHPFDFPCPAEPYGETEGA